MPTHPVYRKGKVIGYRWGHHGKLYLTRVLGSKGAKDAANKQGVAVHSSGWHEPRNRGFLPKVVVRRRRKDGVRQRYHVNAMQPKKAKTIAKEKIIAEPKYDGTRMTLFVDDKGHKLINRRDVVKNDIFPEFDKIAKNIKGSAIIDGEMVVLDKEHPFGNFEKLAARDRLKNKAEIKKRSGAMPATFIAFDILKKDGIDLTEKPLMDRKKVLDNTIKQGPLIKEIEFSNKAEALFNKIKRSDGEGIVIKEINSKYHPGKTRFWEKIKTSKENDVAITGATPGTGARVKTFGALKMSVNTKKGLKEVGLVGTGFSQDDLADITKRVKKGEKLVARVKYRKIGSQGGYIEPRFVALRSDITQKQTHE